MIFVLGVGRSGTSTVARIIHQKNIACMGHEFPQPNGFNPLGYWEDKEVRRLLSTFLTGNVSSFVVNVEKLHRNRGCNKPILGFKHPVLCGVPREVWLSLQPKAIYWCTRPKEATIVSMMRFREFNRGSADVAKATHLYNNRMEMLSKNLDNLPFVKTIDFSEYRMDEWVLKQILTSL